MNCDGMICSTPAGSTAYNLSNGGPVLVRGLDAMAVTFIAPHSLDARPLVVSRGAELLVRNATPDVGAAVLVDGHHSGDLAPERTLMIGDSVSDVLAGRNAGAWTCGVNYGFGSPTLDEASPDIRIDDLRELPKLLNGTA